MDNSLDENMNEIFDYLYHDHDSDFSATIYYPQLSISNVSRAIYHLPARLIDQYIGPFVIIFGGSVLGAVSDRVGNECGTWYLFHQSEDGDPRFDHYVFRIDSNYINSLLSKHLPYETWALPRALGLIEMEEIRVAYNETAIRKKETGVVIYPTIIK